MLPKKNKVDKKKIEKIFREGKFINSPSLIFRFIKNDSPEVQISFIAPKSVAKNAVKRNSLKRRGYAVLKKYLPNFPLGISGVFIFKNSVIPAPILEEELKNILKKL